jgi:hypothetical protein
MQGMGTRRTFGCALLISASWVVPGPSTAQTAAACASISDNAQRLSCYDNLFRKGPAEQPVGSVTAPQRVATQSPPHPSSAEAPAGEFGGEFRPPKSGPKTLKATVTGVAPLGQGLYRLTLDNGQVWTTTQADWTLAFESNDSVTISRMMLGNYVITRASQGHAVGVKRVH